MKIGRLAITTRTSNTPTALMFWWMIAWEKDGPPPIRDLRSDEPPSKNVRPIRSIATIG